MVTSKKKLAIILSLSMVFCILFAGCTNEDTKNSMESERIQETVDETEDSSEEETELEETEDIPSEDIEF